MYPLVEFPVWPQIGYDKWGPGTVEDRILGGWGNVKCLFLVLAFLFFRTSLRSLPVFQCVKNKSKAIFLVCSEPNVLFF